MRVRNATTGEVIASDVRRADGVLERMVGLLNRKHVDRDEGIWFPKCGTIHTVGMSEAIDVVFLDRDNRVMHMLRNVPRNRLAVSCVGAHSTLELGYGALDGRDVLVGDVFVLE